MRKSALAVICLIVAAPTSRAMGQDYLNFSFDYTAHAFVDLRGNGDETDEGVSWVSAGCEAERGCGFSWSTSSLVLLFLTSAGLRVRRPRRDGAEPSGR